MTGRGREDVTLAPRPSNVCICFHVPLHKLLAFIRQRHPRVASQLSECFGAGTGCGWCIPFLEKIHEATSKDPQSTPDLGLSEAEYLARRREYHQKINFKVMKDQREEGEQNAPGSRPI
jgi:NAD(P)H-nitrite reductase large subunit